MNSIVETIVISLQEMLASTIKAIPGLLTAVIIVFLTRYLADFVEQIADKTGKRTLRTPSLQILFNKTSRVAVWAIGGLIACVVIFPGLDLGDIIATLGIGSVAIGFAFQDICKNFLAGILLLLEEPFRIGDEVIIGDYQGKIEQIDIRTTQICTYEGEKVLLPNSTVFTNAVKVRTAYSCRRTDLGVGVDYNTSLPQASQVLAATIQQVEGVMSHPNPEIDLVNFGDSSIDFVVRYWTRPQQKEVRQIQTKAIAAIKQAFDEASIKIPYPIRTLYSYEQGKYFPTDNQNN